MWLPGLKMLVQRYLKVDLPLQYRFFRNAFSRCQPRMEGNNNNNSNKALCAPWQKTSVGFYPDPAAGWGKDEWVLVDNHTLQGPASLVTSTFRLVSPATPHRSRLGQALPHQSWTPPNTHQNFPARSCSEVLRESPRKALNTSGSPGGVWINPLGSPHRLAPCKGFPPHLQVEHFPFLCTLGEKPQPLHPRQTPHIGLYACTSTHNTSCFGLAGRPGAAGDPPSRAEPCRALWEL